MGGRLALPPQTPVLLHGYPKGFTMITSRRFASSSVLGAAVVAASIGAASCAPDKLPFQEDEVHVFAGGMEVNGHELNRGYESYTRYCYACHGPNGDGKGPSSYGYRPPPRNFTMGIFKFARMRTSDDVPNDDDLVRIVLGGLHGTPMLDWKIPEDELRQVIQYIKTFSPKRWEKKKKNGQPVPNLDPWEAPADPWAGKDAEAIQRGKELYHFKAECATCHPSFGTRKELYETSVAANKREPDTFKPMTGFRDDFYGSVPKDSSEYGVRILPPDFTFSQVRSVREGHEMEDLFRVISFGVYPIMPAWQGALEDKDIWAIAHYVKSLMAMRDTKEATAMREHFAVQAAFEVPKPEEPKPAEPAPAADEKKDDAKKGDVKKDEKAK
jgi:mono/diheme cytochrome c family protein